MSSAKHTSPLRHASFSLPNPRGSSQPCVARGRSGCGGDIRGRSSDTPGVPLLPSPPPSHPLLFLNPGRWLFCATSHKQTIPTLPFGQQPRPVLPTHTTLAPSGFRSGLARGFPTSQGIWCPGMQLIWLSPPCECWGRLLAGASREPRAPSPAAALPGRPHLRQGGGRGCRRRKRH